MNTEFQNIENLLGKQSISSKFKESIIKSLPKKIAEIHHYKLFGSNLLALPAKLIINEEEEYLEVFENEYREVIPNIFFPFVFI